MMRPVGYRIVDMTTKHHILMIASVVEEDMMVLAVVQENGQEGLRAGRGGTRQPYDTRRQRDGIESLE
jgi:hypothetical protein